MKYRPEIDGLRAIAVIPVIFFHAGFSIFSGGFVGVDIFFVISGYLITSIILSELKKDRFSITNFYERRARRILPALFFVMICCIPLSWMLLLPDDMRSFAKSVVAVSTFASNFFFWRTSGYFDTAVDLKPLIHTWSLSVEEQYYLLFPPLLIVGWKSGRKPLLIGMILVTFASFIAAQHLTAIKPMAAFYLLPTRAWELMVGALLALHLAEHNTTKRTGVSSQLCSLAGITLIFFSIFCFDKYTPFPSFYTLAPTLGAALIIFSCTRPTLVGKLLSGKILVGLGLLSYSAYLWHQPLFAFARLYRISSPSLSMMVGLSILSFCFAYFSWKFVERPFRNRNRLQRKTVFIGALTCMASFLALGLLGALEIIKPRISALQTQETRNYETGACSSRYPKVVTDNCAIIGALNVKPTVLLLGDSHAGAIADSLNEALKGRGIAAQRITLGGCTPIKNVSINSPFFFDECIELNRYVYDHLLTEEQFSHVILLSRWTAHWESVSPFNNQEGGIEAELFEGSNNNQLVFVSEGKVSHDRKLLSAQYMRSLASIASHSKLILIYPVPEAGWNIPRLFSRSLNYTLDNQLGSTSTDVFLRRNSNVLTLFDQLDFEIIRIKPHELFCNTYVSGRCVTVLNRQPLYYDDDHLSNYGASLVVREIINHLP